MSKWKFNIYVSREDWAAAVDEGTWPECWWEEGDSGVPEDAKKLQIKIRTKRSK